MYSTFAAKTTSEKLTAVWMEPSQRLASGWVVHSGSIYRCPVQHWVVGLLHLGTAMASVASIGAVTAGTFFFDSTTKTLYARLADSSNPRSSHVEAIYRLFFADGPIDLPFDLEDGTVVPYLPYLSSASNGGSRFDPNSPQIPVEGSGKVNLLNDGFFAPIFDKLTWQTKRAAVFSVSREGDSAKLYEGLITTKSYNGSQVSFGLKDELYRLRSQIDLPLFSEDDGTLSDALLGKPKRRIYGRVAGLKAESLDQQLDGYLVSTIDGDDRRTSTPITFSTTVDIPVVTASSVDVKKELVANDRITIDQVDYRVKTLSRREFGLNGATDITFTKILSNTLRIQFTGIDTSRLTTSMHLAVASIKNGAADLNAALFGISPIVAVTSSYFDVQLDTSFSVATATAKVEPDELCVVANSNDVTFYVSDEAPATKTGLTARVKATIPYRRLNRNFQIAHHGLHEVEATIVKVKRGNLFEVSTVADLAVGDTIVFDNTNVAEIADVDANANTVRTTALVNPLPQTGDTMKRVAIQDVVFDNLTFTPLRDYEVSNLPTGATCLLSSLAEQQVATIEAAGSFIWENGSKVVVGSGSRLGNLQPRDWVKPSSDSDWVEIEEIFNGNIAILKTPYSGPSGLRASAIKKPSYIGDKSNVLVDSYGTTFDGTPSGSLVRTVPDAVKHLLSESGIANIDDPSFAIANESAPYLVSYTVPLKPREAPKSYRDTIDDLNSSVLGAAFVSPEFMFKYRVLNAKRSMSEATFVTDYDVKDFKQKADSSTIYGKIVAQYRHQDLDRITEESTYLVAEAESRYVTNAGVENQSLNVDVYLYDSKPARRIASRLMFFNELPRTELELDGSLNLSQMFLTDLVVFRGDSLYTRYGSSDQSIIGVVTASTKSGQGARIVISDLGNIFSRTCVIAPNGTPEYASATADQRRFAGFITATDGTIEGDEDVGTNLIS